MTDATFRMVKTFLWGVIIVPKDIDRQLRMLANSRGSGVGRLIREWIAEKLREAEPRMRSWIPVRCGWCQGALARQKRSRSRANGNPFSAARRTLRSRTWSSGKPRCSIS